ncbi:MAG TPA: flagellar assembly protein FliH [Sulfuricurvum sp.]|nr:flagellar assembly protein FliH [Sulfuricurvum sp.]
MEDVVITKANLNNHSIGKYQFKILSGLSGGSVREAADELEFQQNFEHSTELSPHYEVTTAKDDLIESLLKKADDMSSNFIKMQMRLEDLQEEHAKALEEVKKSSFDEGVLAGIAQEQAQSSQHSTQARDQLSTSVKTLDEAASQYAITLEKIQQELTHTALEIAKEVIGIETQENSAKIAAKLSEALIEELGEASKITLRVNPADHGMISEKVGSLKHVEVLSDRAISPGGVVAISDFGNIDSQIKKRFERLKRSLLLES